MTDHSLHFHQPHRATIDMGGMVIHLNKRVCWFHRLMYRLAFGWKVTNV